MQCVIVKNRNLSKDNKLVSRLLSSLGTRTRLSKIPLIGHILFEGY